MDDTPGHGRGIDLRGVGQFFPGTASGWPAGLCIFLVESHSGMFGGNTIRGWGDLQLGHLYLGTRHTYYPQGGHVVAAKEILRIIGILEEHYTEVQGIITSLHLAATLL